MSSVEKNSGLKLGKKLQFKITFPFGRLVCLFNINSPYCKSEVPHDR